MLFSVANSSCWGLPKDAACKILQDACKGCMGPICWEAARLFGTSNYVNSSNEPDDWVAKLTYRKEDEEAQLEQQRIGRQALEAAQD
jgi:hypothetical protein